MKHIQREKKYSPRPQCHKGVIRSKIHCVNQELLGNQCDGSHQMTSKAKH